MPSTSTRTTSSKKAPAKKASAKKPVAKNTLKKSTSAKKRSSSSKKDNQKKIQKIEKTADDELVVRDPNKKKKGFHMLSAFSILFIIIALLVVVSWVLQWTGVMADVPVLDNNGKPSTDDHGNIVTEPKKIAAMGLVDIFYSVFEGFANKVEIIVFILVLGAFITIVINSKALDGFANAITSKLKGKEVFAIIPLMLFFSICGTVEGMAEESLGFYMICIPLMMAAGFDTFTGFLIVMVGAGIGTLASTVNPFAVSVAVDGLNTANKEFISVGDGLVWRLISWLIMTAAAIGFVMWYALRVKKNPKKSVTFSTYEGDKAYFLGNQEAKIVMDWRKKLTLALFAFAFLIMIVYLIGWDDILGTDVFKKAGEAVNKDAPYVTALVPGFGHGSLMVPGMFFLISAIVTGLVNGLGEDKFLSQFMAGAGDILSVCLIIATAGGIGVILSKSHMQELFVKGLAGSIGSLPAIAKVIILYLIFIVLSFIIPSSSGFAMAIFPIIAGTVAKDPNVAANMQIADPVAGSGSVQAFVFASGLVNLFTPTSGVVMGALAIARIDYNKFLKGMWPILAGAAVLSIVLLAVGGVIGGTIA